MAERRRPAPEAGPSLAMVDAGRVQLSYRETGRGEPVVLLNGTGESSESWTMHMEALARARRCVAIDFRDAGASDRAGASYTPADLAADVARAIETLDLGAVDVVGFSLGGAVAQELALAHPSVVRSVVLLSTWHATDPWFASQMRSWQTLRRAHADDDHAFDEALAPWLFAPATFARPELLDRIYAMWDAVEQRQEPEAFVRQCDADIAHVAGDRLRTLEVPALVVVGSDDICTPPRYARALCDLIPRARLVDIPDAGHCAVFEQAEAVRDAIQEFLRAR